jgi:ATP-dependent DNA ligase
LRSLRFEGARANQESCKFIFGSSLALVWFRHACRLGLEGIVAKKTAARFRSGQCASWVKVKNPEYERR